MIGKIDRKKWYSFKLFLYVLPFLVLVLLFAYYPLYGWLYAFYDYRPPRPFSEAEFVGLKWFKSLVENPVKVSQLLQVLKNTFVMSGITLGTSWLPMLFAVFLNEIRQTAWADTGGGHKRIITAGICCVAAASLIRVLLPNAVGKGRRAGSGRNKSG